MLMKLPCSAVTIKKPGTSGNGGYTELTIDNNWQTHGNNIFDPQMNADKHRCI